MKKKFGMTFGGLQQKIFNLCLISLLILVGFGITIFSYQQHKQKTVVSDINERQKDAMREETMSMMEAQAQETVVDDAETIAEFAENYFDYCITAAGVLKDRAEVLFNEHILAAEDDIVQPPELENEGTLSTQMVYSTFVTDQDDPKLREDVRILSGMKTTLESVYTHSNYSSTGDFTVTIGSVYIAVPSGAYIITDEHAANKFDEDGKVKPFAFQRRDWYKDSMRDGGLQFADVMYDYFTGKMEVICTVPVMKKGTDEIMAIIGIDVFFDSLQTYFDNVKNKDSIVCVLNTEGKVLFSSERNGIFAPSSDTKDLRALKENPELAEVITASYHGKVKPQEITIDGERYIITSDKVDNLRWPLLVAMKSSVLEAPGERLADSLEDINDDGMKSFADRQKAIIIMSVISMVVILIVVVMGALIIGKRIVNPLRSMTKKVHDLSGTNLAFTMYDELRTHDEIEELGEAFADLSQRTLMYISENNKITSEKERIGTELNLATNIQSSMLPSIFPAFPNRPEIDIYASMDPAKEVGGDFYDFFFVDGSRLALVIADVSGKGVPAALFMMMSKILLNNYSMLVESPARIMELVNDQLCKDNKSRMFVTVWLGILDIETGKVTCVNAGHEFPAIKRGDHYELLHDKHGFMAGARKGKKYTEYEIQLEPGDGIFVYTDGVAEATNAHDELYGTERMMEALNTDPSLPPEDTIKAVRSSVDDFVKNTPQFDDITMLNIIYKGC